jgi:hypothetical protein
MLYPNEYCRYLSLYLKDYLNSEYAQARLENPSLPDALIVRTAKEYDAINIPLSEFPLLKVYRGRDSYRKGTTIKDVSATLTYSLSYPELDVLPDLLTWVSEKLNYAFMAFQRDEKSLLYTQNPSPLSVQYLLMANEQTRTVYPFLRADFTFRETSQSACKIN